MGLLLLASLPGCVVRHMPDWSQVQTVAPEPKTEVHLSRIEIPSGVGTRDPQLSRLEPNRFFRNNDDGTFSDSTMASGLGQIGKGHGVTFIDYDGDGDLDIYVQIGAADPGDMWEKAFYRNEKGHRNHWLQVDLAGTRSNRQGVGATLVARAGGLIVHREVKGSEGFGSTNPYRVSFGLGRTTRVESLEVN